MPPVAPPRWIMTAVQNYFRAPSFWLDWMHAAGTAWSSMPTAQLTSWYRDPATNARVGGSPQSQHLWGGALDFAMPGVGSRHIGNPDAERLADAFRRAGFVAVVEPDHVHVQTFPAR